MAFLLRGLGLALFLLAIAGRVLSAQTPAACDAPGKRNEGSTVNRHPSTGGDILCIGGASVLRDEALRPQLAGKLFPDGTRLVAGRINWWGRDPAWKDVNGVRGPKDLEKPLGEWNRLELVCKGDAYVFYVNGTKANEAKGAEPKKGKILFQSEGAEIFFRNIEIRSLR